MWYRWLPEYLASREFYNNLSFKGLIGSDKGKTPLEFREKGEPIVFLEATEHYWKAYLPMTVLTSIALFFVYRFVQSYRWLAKRLVAFCTLLTLMWPLCVQNIEYLSFRCFTQLTMPIASSATEYINLVSCYLVLFAVVVLAICLPFIIRGSNISYRILFEYLQPRNTPAMCFLAGWNVSRLFLGFCHSFLHSNYSLQMAMLATGHTAALVLTIQFRHCFWSKSVALCYSAMELSKVAMLWVRYAEAVLVSKSSMSQAKLCKITAEIEWMILFVIMATAFLDFVCRTVGLRHRYYSSKQ